MNLKAQSGNVLFLILIAVVLFAALSYAVTSSSRTGSTGIGDEDAKMAASRILQWIAAVDVALMRLKAAGFANENISFGYEGAKRNNGAYLLNYQNNPLCLSDACRVFRPSGGGAVAPDFSQIAMPPDTASPTSLAPGYMVTYVLPWPNAGSSANDVVLFITGIPNKICEALNRGVGIVGIPNSTRGGSCTQGGDVSTWDSPTTCFISNPTNIADVDTFAGPLTPGNCLIAHVLLKR